MKISDDQVLAILRANASKNQGTERPILALFRNGDGSLNRARIVETPAYTLTGEEVAEILAN